MFNKRGICRDCRRMEECNNKFENCPILSFQATCYWCKKPIYGRNTKDVFMYFNHTFIGNPMCWDCKTEKNIEHPDIPKDKIKEIIKTTIEKKPSNLDKFL